MSDEYNRKKYIRKLRERDRGALYLAKLLYKFKYGKEKKINKEQLKDLKFEILNKYKTLLELKESIEAWTLFFEKHQGK